MIEEFDQNEEVKNILQWAFNQPDEKYEPKETDYRKRSCGTCSS